MTYLQRSLAACLDAGEQLELEQLGAELYAFCPSFNSWAAFFWIKGERLVLSYNGQYKVTGDRPKTTGETITETVTCYLSQNSKPV